MAPPSRRHLHECRREGSDDEPAIGPEELNQKWRQPLSKERH
jgi:hypothetical protein